MKWFKHDSDASNDAKLRKLRLKYGAQGYGIYWYCLELIARNVDKNNLTFELEHDAELIADDFRMPTSIVEEMMLFMVNLGLFENIEGKITCLKMSTRTDEYTQKLINNINNCPDNVPTISKHNPENSALIEEKRREENKNTPLALLVSMGVEKQIASDWLAVRKVKKSAPTKTSFEKIKTHAEANGFTFSEAVKIACENNWAGFNVSWLSREEVKKDSVPAWMKNIDMPKVTQ